MTWSLRKITNNYSQDVSIPYISGNGAKFNGTLPPVGSLSIAIPGHGALTFTDVGHTNFGATGRSWNVLINYQSQAWVYGYEGGGVIDLVINADGSVALHGENWPVVPLQYSKK